MSGPRHQTQGHRTQGRQLQITARLAGGDRRFRLDPGEHVIGSGAGAELRLDEPTVSRRHLQVAFDGEAVSLTDLGSSNGTWQAGQRILKTTLDGGLLELRLGEVSVRFERLDPEEVRLAVPGDSPAPRVASRDESRATWGGGALSRFSLRELPMLLEAIARGEDADMFAPRLASALATLLPDIGITLRHADAVVAVAGDATDTMGRTLEHGTWALLATGAADELERNEPLLGLALRLLAASGARRGAPELTRPTFDDSAGLPDPPTQSAALRDLYRQAARVAPSEIGVLIRGETGTGKELFARYLHAASGLPADRLVTLNCAALPADLLEAELFGIEKGVATGVTERAGRFEEADGGTLFLDEIGDMALETQAKILRVLQEKQVYRLGSNRPRSARVRVVSATNRDVEAMVESGEFRRDLYHRLADWTVELPALRRRRIDIANLAAHFLAAEMKRQGKRFGGLSEAAVGVLLTYPWPGNVRELEREMLRCSLFLESGEPMQSAQLQPRFHRAATETGDVTLKAQLERAEAAAIRDALAETAGDIEVAADRLGCGKSTLYRRISQLGIEI